MNLRPITFNAQCPEGQYSTVALGFDAMGHSFACYPHPWQANLMLVSHVKTGFLFTKVHTSDAEVAAEKAIERLNYCGALHLDRAIAKANAMYLPRVAAVN